MSTRRARAACLLAAILLAAAACSDDDGTAVTSTSAATATTGGGSSLPGIHVVGFSADGLTVGDADGSNPRAVAVPDGFVPLLSSSMGQWAVESTASSTFRYVDLAAGEQHSVDLPADGLTPVPATVRNGSNEVLLDTPGGGRVVVVDLAEGTATALGRAGVAYFPSGARAEALVFFDPEGVQSLVVPEGEPSAAWEVPGSVVAVQGVDTLVSTPGGGATQLAHYHGTEAQGKAATMLLVGAMLTPTGALAVGLDGSVNTVDFTTGTSTQVSAVDPNTQDVNARPVADDRLLAWGPTGSTLLAADGTVVASFPLTGGQPLAPTSTAQYGACIGLQPGDAPVGSGGGALLADTASGAVLAELDSSAIAVSADGCTVITVGSPTQLVVDRQPVDLDLDRVLAVSPDRSTVVGRGANGLVLVPIGGGQGASLPDGAYGFAQF